MSDTTVDRLDLAASPLGNDIEFLTARARSLGSEIANRALEPLGLRVRSYSLLACAQAEYRPTQRRLADFLRLDPSQVVALVDGLEREGLVRRESDPDDRRSKVVIATRAGEELLVAAQAAIADAQEVTLGTLTAAERDVLRGLLRRVALPQEP